MSYPLFQHETYQWALGEMRRQPFTFRDTTRSMDNQFSQNISRKQHLRNLEQSNQFLANANIRQAEENGRLGEQLKEAGRRLGEVSGALKMLVRFVDAAGQVPTYPMPGNDDEESQQQRKAIQDEVTEAVAKRVEFVRQVTQKVLPELIDMADNGGGLKQTQRSSSRYDHTY